ncbi:hypothetical protein BX600DRAFT_457364 [Xylariales sp. PMI_506]|nr:hypothetical protein BX600DRAFT_457364 [Xylariales sp. PMI_506]
MFVHDVVQCIQRRQGWMDFGRFPKLLHPAVAWYGTCIPRLCTALIPPGHLTRPSSNLRWIIVEGPRMSWLCRIIHPLQSRESESTTQQQQQKLDTRPGTIREGLWEISDGITAYRDDITYNITSPRLYPQARQPQSDEHHHYRHRQSQHQQQQQLLSRRYLFCL